MNNNANGGLFSGVEDGGFDEASLDAYLNGDDNDFGPSHGAGLGAASPAPRTPTGSVFGNVATYRVPKRAEWAQCLRLLEDPQVSEIQSNGPSSFFMKRAGQRSQLDIALPSLEDYSRGVAEGLVPFVRAFTPFDPTSYLFEGPLVYKDENGADVRGRVHVVLPPATLSPQVTIAKKSTLLTSLDQIALSGSMASEMRDFIKMSVNAGLTIAISGSTGSGKTTMLESLLKLVPGNVRVGVGEDTPELYLSQPNVTYLQSVPWQPGMDPNSVATLSWVVSQFQRNRVDRIVVGETRGREFADFLVAANSGMEGSMTTIHANDPKACLAKMARFAMMASGNQPIRAINMDIASGIDIIIQLEIARDGSHKMTSITEVTSTISNDESAAITTEELFSYNKMDGNFYKKAHPGQGIRDMFDRAGISAEAYTNNLGRPGDQLSAPRANYEEAQANRIAAPAASAFGRRGVPRDFGDGGRTL